MNPTVQAALIAAAASIIVNLLNNWQQSKKRAVETAKKDTELSMQLKNIEKKLDEHNGYAEKIGSIQQDISYIRGKLDGGGA
ncbi:MAG: hypothetical protein IKF93_06850 [Lachnospiraceae bacterium]|nr:hypothetical protein [Lachnospiraceae bacterium]